MKALSQATTPFSRALLTWIADRIALIMTTTGPTHRAASIAVRVAASGNPSGA